MSSTSFLIDRLNRYRAGEIWKFFDQECNQEFDLELDQQLDQDLDQELDQELNQELDQELDQDLDQELDQEFVNHSIRSRGVEIVIFCLSIGFIKHKGSFFISVGVFTPFPRRNYSPVKGELNKSS
jgi:hypothetical protein